MNRALKLRRVSRVVALLVKYGVALGASRVLPASKRLAGPLRLRRLLEEVGGTFLKFGQILSLQPDVMPRAYCEELFNLLDRVPPFPYRDVERIFREDLGRGPREIFDSFETEPLASASIGQVYAARLEGRKLAVKVRRPRVETDFAADLRLMNLLADSLVLLGTRRWRWLVRAIREFSTWTVEELDYRYEMRFMGSLRFNARDNPRERVPEPVAKYSTHRILVAEFLEGPTVLEYIRHLSRPDPGLEARLRAAGFDEQRLARNIVRNFVSDAFHHGLFHADLHPANLVILPGSVVGYVDFGITGSLSHYSRRHMIGLTLAMTRADLDSMIHHFFKISSTDPDADAAAFKQGLRDLLGVWFEGEGAARTMRRSFSMIMLDMLQLSRQTGIWPTPDVIRYIRSVITADGLIGRFAPDLDIGDYLESVCADYLTRVVWREWASVENLADWTVGGLRLLSRGPATVDRILERLDSSGCAADQERAASGSRCAGALQSAALQLAVIVFACAVLAGRADLRAVPGFNIATAALLVAGAGALMFLKFAAQLVYSKTQVVRKGGRS